MALTFGTGGLRGLLGEGEDRINAGTIAHATRGVAKWVLGIKGIRAKRAGVVIAYDTRHQSDMLAGVTAAVLEQAGIPAYVFEHPTPTPVLSFAVQNMQCAAGIVITASHNPREYNGYKVYNAMGCQIVPSEADVVIRCIQEAAPAEPPAPIAGRAVPPSVGEAYIQAVLAQGKYRDAQAKKALSIVYTPLHGTGKWFVPEVLKKAGFTGLTQVESQATYDGSFATVSSPNPEDKAALRRGIKLAASLGADIVIGTDPDCDRVGAAVLHQGRYVLISGNQMGALLMDYIIRQTKRLPKDGAVVKTIVTNDLGAQIARSVDLDVFETLTGFKFIGEKINKFDADKDHTFVFGYEESYGYLTGTYTCDKDAVVASLLICEMAALHKQEGRTLVDVREALYARFGTFLDGLRTIESQSLEDTEAILAKLRRGGGEAFSPTATMVDYASGPGGLPPSDVLKFTWPDGAWVAVRPSGTEPKLKIYYAAYGRTQTIARAVMKDLQSQMNRIVQEV